MVRQARAADAARDHDGDDLELRKITIAMPTEMLDELRRRARRRGVTVTELIRRAVAVEKMLFDDASHEVILRDKESGKETAVRVI